MALPDDTLRTALAAHEAGDLVAAEALYDRVLREQPGNFLALHMRGVVALQTGRAAEAERLIARALALNPGSVRAAANHGNALQELGRYEEAIASYDRAVALDGGFAEALSNRGNALRALGRAAEALDSFDHAVSIKPSYARGWSNRGLALLDAGRVDDAQASFERALALDPGLAEAHCNLGLALYAAERFNEALASFERALALRPAYPEALSNRGACLKELERFEEALASFAAALRLRPGYADAHYNRGLALLLLGRLPEGWSEYEYRPTGPIRRHGFPTLPVPVWAGEPLAGKRVIVLAEQGFGDTIQFVRYLPLLRPMVAELFFYTRPFLVRLCRGLEGVGTGSEMPDASRFDLAIPLLSLPHLFATAQATIPAEIPYLKAEPDRVLQWRARIGSHGFRVGVCWQGNATSAANRGRSFPARLLAPLAAVPGVRLISLQQQDGLEQLASLPPDLTIETLEDAECDGNAFVDTAAIMESLDLIVSCDTAIAHLAGATGRPVWMAVKRVKHWAWLTEGEHTPWYPTMRIFRQREIGDWREVLHRMAAELGNLLPNSKRS